MTNLKHLTPHGYKHEGTNKEHSTVEANVADRSDLNYCGECNGWFYRGFPNATAAGEETTLKLRGNKVMLNPCAVPGGCQFNAVAAPGEVYCPNHLAKR